MEEQGKMIKICFQNRRCKLRQQPKAVWCVSHGPGLAIFGFIGTLAKAAEVDRTWHILFIRYVQSLFV